VEYPLKFSINDDHMSLMLVLSVGSQFGYRPEKIDITVPDLPEGKYYIHLYNEGNKADAFSELFQLTRTQMFSVSGHAANYVNTHYKGRLLADWEQESDKAVSRELATVSDPGPNKFKYGYQHWYWPDYEGDEYWLYHIHRSLVRFNTTVFQVKHKPSVKSAEITFSRAGESPNKNCPPVIWVMDAQVPFVDDALFYPVFDSLPKHKLTAENCAFMVQLWLEHPEMNYGLVVQAEYEGEKRTEGSCVQINGDIRLKCMIEDKLD